VFALLFIIFNLVGDTIPILEALHVACELACVRKNILTTVVRRDESETFVRDPSLQTTSFPTATVFVITRVLLLETPGCGHFHHLLLWINHIGDTLPSCYIDPGQITLEFILVCMDFLRTIIR